ncbi:MAG: HU family DNA-binding protein [Gemmatimonadetes bacterium]|nr:HU family DNA-binding protein [Gemmatimonadota bacterium]
MNKSQFIAMVAEKAEMSRSAAARAVDAIFDTAGGAISEAVNTAGHLSIPGFGKFTSKKRAARTGRNPRTGLQIQIPERTTVSFSPGKGLKESASTGGGSGGRKGASKSAGGSKTAKAAKTTGAAKTRAAATKQTRESSGAATKSTAKKSSGGGSTAKKSTGGATKTASKSTAKKSR